jgi:hypothetical protein
MHAPAESSTAPAHPGPQKAIVKRTPAILRRIGYQEIYKVPDASFCLRLLAEQIEHACLLNQKTLDAIRDLQALHGDNALKHVRNTILVPINEEIQRREKEEELACKIPDSIRIEIIQQPKEAFFGHFFHTLVKVFDANAESSSVPGSHMCTEIIAADNETRLAENSFHSTYHIIDKAGFCGCFLVLPRGNHPNKILCRVRFKLYANGSRKGIPKVHYSEVIEVTEKEPVKKESS